MTALVWGREEDRISFRGVDRGVLYPENSPGVAWDGLVAIDEIPLSGDAEEYYFEGISYLQLVPSNLFQATIKAYSAPFEFAACMGETHARPGFIITRQPRVRFGMAFRTFVGGGYQIHLIYNATASTSSRAYSTLSSTTDPDIREWKLEAVPPLTDTYKPTAHLMIDSRVALPFTLEFVEEILYGTANVDPTLPPQETLLSLF